MVQRGNCHLPFGVTFGTIRRMELLQSTLSRLERYAALAGATPEAIARKATNNPRMLNRLMRRVDRVNDDLDRLNAFMDANALESGVCATRHNKPSQKASIVQEQETKTGKEISETQHPQGVAEQ